MKTSFRSSYIVPLVIFMTSMLSLGGCKKPGNTIGEIFRFRDTKEVIVQVNINFKEDAAIGPAVDTSTDSFILNAFLLENGSQTQVPLALIGSVPSFDLPVTLDSTSVVFDSKVRVPASTQPGANGYAIHFALKNVAQTSLADTADYLDALKGGIQPGLSASSNVVNLSLASTIAYNFTKEIGLGSGTTTLLEAYNSVISIVIEQVRLIEAQVLSETQTNLATYFSAVKAATQLKIMQTLTIQTDIFTALKPAVIESAGDQAVNVLATSMTSILKSYASPVKSALGSDQTSESKLFKVGAIDHNNIPDPTSYKNVIFAPTAVAFIDTDTGSTVGGAIVISLPASEDGLESYNIYFGGSTAETSKIKLIGNVLKGTQPLEYVLPVGTEVPTGATRFWVYPVSKGSDLDLSTYIEIANTENAPSGGASGGAGAVAAAVFGAPFGNYMEDGLSAVCAKLSNTIISCKGSFFDGVNDLTTITGWSTGASIRGYYTLEATTFIEDSNGDIWSVGGNSSTPIGRTGIATDLIKMTFTGKNPGTHLLGIHGEHQRASALFDDGQLFSWAASNAPAVRLAAGSHTNPIKYIYEGYGHECFIDSLNDLYCKTSTPNAAAYTWTPTSAEKVTSNALAVSMPYNAGRPWDIVLKKTDGKLYTAVGPNLLSSSVLTDTGIVASEAAGLFGFSPIVGIEEFLAIDTNGSLHNKSGVLSSFGTNNLAVGASYGGVGGYNNFVLSNGQLLGSAVEAMTSTEAFGGFNDVTAMRSYYQDVCAIRANKEVYCAGQNAGGTYAAPTLLGTMQ
jgi:hypothetical protein